MELCRKDSTLNWVSLGTLITPPSPRRLKLINQLKFVSLNFYQSYPLENRFLAICGEDPTSNLDQMVVHGQK